jgi:hypothetical protein
VIITHRNKPRLVLLSIEDYRRPAAGADTRGTLETMPDTLFEDLKEAVSAYERDLRYSLSLSLGAGSRAWRDGGPEGSSGGRGVRIWLVLLPITSQPPAQDRFAVEKMEKRRAGLDATVRLWMILDEYTQHIIGLAPKPTTTWHSRRSSDTSNTSQSRAHRTPIASIFSH